MGNEMEHVILLHGLGGHGMTMSVIHKHIETNTNLTVHNWSYFSLFSTIDEIVEYIARRIETTFSEHDIINIVGHSLGGLIARGVISKLEHKLSFKHVITIGTPHAGATLANRILKILPFIGNVSPIVIDLSKGSRQIQTHPSIPPSVKHGVIAGSRKLNYYNPLLVLSAVMMVGIKHSDGIVEHASTRTERYDDYLLTDDDHLSLLFSSKVTEAIVNFLTYSRFSR